MSKLAVCGGTPIRSEPYPAWPVWDERDIAAVTKVVESGRWGGSRSPVRERLSLPGGSQRRMTQNTV